MANILTWMFEKLPEYSYKQYMREFLAFSRLVPKSIQDLSPIKGYEMYRKLREGDIVVDAGAYPGDYTLYAARKVGSTGLVIAFEPNADNRRILERNIKSFGLKNVIVVPKGLYNENGFLRLTSDGLHSTSGEMNKNDDEELIEVCRLDDEIERMKEQYGEEIKNKLKNIHVIKMDIEGAEVKAILGAVNTLKNNNVYCTIAAYHSWDILPVFTTEIPLKSFFSKQGFDTIVDYPKHTTLFALNASSWKRNKSENKSEVPSEESLKNDNIDLNSSVHSK